MKLNFKELDKRILEQFDGEELKAALSRCLTRVTGDDHTFVDCELKVTEPKGLRLGLTAHTKDFPTGGDTGFSDEARFFGASGAMQGYAKALNEKGIKVESSNRHYWSFNLDFADADALALFINHGEKEKEKKISVAPQNGR